MADEYKQFTTELLSRIDIVDVVGSRIDLKKAGREHHACCPFHNEKTPSFTVSPQKQFYYCFGCHAKGDAITFIMQFDRLPFLEACEKLAHSVGLTPPNYQKKPLIDRSLYKLLRDYTITSKNDLQNNPEMQSYISQRGIPFSVQKDFHLGYSGPDSVRFIQNKLKDKESTNNLRECGLLSERDHKLQAKFYKRILFPIQDTQGRIIAFGGRVTDPDRQPKYLNSPETILFKKRQVLYGLYQLSKSVHELVYVVEGYMDVLALNSHDIKNSVACLGTAFTPQHWKLITRYTDKIYFCFDGDKAGMRAAWLTLTNILPALTPEKNAYFMFMPPGEDPDSFCQKSGRSAFIKLSQQAQSWDVFFIDQLQSRYDFTTVSGKAGLLDEAKKHISTMQHQILATTLEQALSTQPNNKSPQPTTIDKPDKHKTGKYQQLINTIFSQLLSKTQDHWHYPKLIDNPTHLHTVNAINTCLNLLKDNPKSDHYALRNLLDNHPSFQEIEEHLSISPTNFRPTVITGSIHQLRISLLEKSIQQNLQISTDKNPSHHDRKIVHALILEKKQIESDYLNLLNDPNFSDN